MLRLIQQETPKTIFNTSKTFSPQSFSDLTRYWGTEKEEREIRNHKPTKQQTNDLPNFSNHRTRNESI